MELIKDYWVQIVFFGSLLLGFYRLMKSAIEATRCSLRNDILDIYDRCKDTKKITHYQLQSIQYSAELYFKLKGNSFVKEVVDRVKNFDLVD